MHYKIAQLIVTPGAKANTTSEVYIAQPDSTKERLGGKLFILAEIDGRSASNLKFIDFIIAELNRNYYQNEKIILREKVSSIKIETIFESALAKTNKNIGELLQNAKFDINLNDLNITIGVVFENELHFSIVGKNKGQLIYKNKNDDDNRYKITETTERKIQEDDSRSLNPNKLFTNIINGSIPPNGYFLFTNETLPEYLSSKQLLEIITTLPPNGALEQVKNLLNQVNAYVSFLGILIKNTTGQAILEIRQTNLKTTSAQNSISSLRTTEDQTERLLTPSGIIDFKKWASGLGDLLASLSFNKGGFSNKEKILLSDKLSFKKRSSFKFLKNFGLLIKHGLIYLLQILIHLPQLLKKDNLLLGVNQFRNNFLNNSLKPIKWFKRLGNKQKIIFIVAIISIILFLQNSLFMNLRNKDAEKKLQDLEIVKLIEQKENQVDSSLLYNNEDGAGKLLVEISNLISQLPQKTTDKQTTSLIERFNQLNIKIRRETKVSPEELADFTKLKTSAQPSNIAMDNGKIYSADATNFSIYTLELNSNLVTDISLPSNDIKTLNSPALNNGNIYYSNLGNIIALDTKLSTTTTIAINSLGNKDGVVDQNFYNNKLYALNNKDKQIYSYSKSASAFSSGAAWLKNSSDLDQPLDFAIDGSIYVLDINGSITKFSKGKKVEFKFSSIQPMLAGSTKIFASTKFLYVLDPKNKRVVVFDKTGKLIVQYQSDKFTNLKDFIIDETARKIFVLNGATVLQFDLQN